ncbi:DUF7344 domain-containing protein [Halobacterium zhouii]|uniref:DUF7344 domain-containing protein n=1 Tax=Halobacterium zhouii TaxID=2902624 RepID=UPI001E63D328|nr:hypothetical protein [Halobacterium zhouii]
MSVKDPSPRPDALATPNTDAHGSEADGERPENEALSRDQVFHLLQNQRRRGVLRYLENAATDRVRMRDVAEAIAAAEHGTSVDALSSKQRQRVYVPLYQNHLPKLDAEGVLDYEQDRGFVERRPAAAQLERHLWPSTTDSESTLTTDRSERSNRSRWSLVAAGVGAGLFGGVTLDVSVFASVPDVVASALVVCLFVAVSLWQALAHSALDDE